ncbi:MAG: hypothetical protein COA74_03530 [Gammaproteobacteria bacterium]|nr:MAG: hypothetical protein COA74_03530 [Gammaproteobacteria bacterium]
MRIQFVVILLLLNLFHHAIKAADNLLWMSYSQIQSDYYGDGNSSLKPDGFNFGYMGDLSEQWQISFNYGKFTSADSWSIEGVENRDLFNQARTESQSIGLGITWLIDDYSISFDYAQQEYTENAISRMPRLDEEISSDDQFYSVSLDSFVGFENWILGWGLGSQYSDSKNKTQQIYRTDPVIMSNSQFDQTRWNVFLDLVIGSSYAFDDFDLLPALSLSWNSELSGDGEPLLVVTRDGERRVFTQFDYRNNNTYRLPDSGLWLISFTFDWKNNWSTSLTYGQNFSADIEVSSWSVDLSVEF